MSTVEGVAPMVRLARSDRLRTVVGVLAVLALPLAGLALLSMQPRLDVYWEHHPSHFWLVLTTAALNAALACATAAAARRRGDARVFLASLAFLAAAGFLGLHALATPGVLLNDKNAGFALATPVGLVAAAAFAAASGAPLSGRLGSSVIRHARLIRGGLVVLLGVWATFSLGQLPPLADSSVPERASGPLVALAAAGVTLYGLAVLRYALLLRSRRSGMLLGLSAAFALLAEAMVAVAFARNWHATWWEWHVLMLTAFALVSWSAQRQWHEERFSSLYLDSTAAGKHEITVLLADLEGFTSFSERHDPLTVATMLNRYFELAVPIIERHGGDVDRIVGDALLAIFNRRGDQPDHPVRAGRAALDIQHVAARIALEQPDWPRFRIGVNTGEAAVVVLGTSGGRTHTVIGDTVNVTARLQAHAPVGGVAISAETLRRLPGSHARALGVVAVKGKAAPVEMHQLLELPARATGSTTMLQRVLGSMATGVTIAALIIPVGHAGLGGASPGHSHLPAPPAEASLLCPMTSAS